MKVLYIMSSYNIYGGTPKKTLDLMKFSKHESFLYVYHKSYLEFKPLFEKVTDNIIEGYYHRNIYKHISTLLKLIDENNIDIIQTQFTFGEVLGGILKILRPKIKLIVAFVTPFKPNIFKSKLVPFFYDKVDAFVYISEYVKNEKEKIFPILERKKSQIIFNGTEKRIVTTNEYPTLKQVSLYSTSGLSDWKNIIILIEAIKIINNKNIFLYVAGDGQERENLEQKIKEYSLKNQVFLLGYQKNIGALLEQADIYVHPAYAEGFGIAVAEAMIAGKPIIVSNEGALPELIENEKSGLVVDAYDSNDWARAIQKLVKDKKFATQLGVNAKKRAKAEFSIEKYVKNYGNLYKELLEKK